VVDPASGKSVAGMIEGLVVKEGHVGFALEVPASRGRDAEPLRQAAETAVHALKGVLSVTAVLTAHQARHAEPERPPAHRHPPSPTGIAGVAAIVAVASGKGGVGKSTVAVNLAIALGAQGLKVGLLDADIYGPSVPKLMGIREKPEQENGKLKPIEKFGI